MLRNKWIALVMFFMISSFALTTGGCGNSPKKEKVGGTWEVPIVINAGDFGIADKVKIDELVANPDVKGVLVDFWATWCEPCKAEMPYLQDIYNEYRDQGLAMVVITIDNSESLEEQIKKDVMEMKREDGSPANITYPIGWDLKQEIKSFYGITSIPVTMLINKENKVVYEHSGFTEDLIEELKEAVHELIVGE